MKTILRALIGVAFVAGTCVVAGSPAPATVYEAEADERLDLTDEVTLEAWVKAEPMPPNGGRVIDKMPPGSMQGYLLDTWPGNSLRLITANGHCRYDAKLSADRWTHVVGVYSATKRIMKLYIDGNEVASETNGKFPQIIKTIAPLRIGVDQNGENKLLGSIRRAAVFRRALTGDEIEKRFRNENAPVKDAVGDWLFERKGPASIQPVAGTVCLWRPVAVRGEAPPPGEPLSVWQRRPGNKWTEATPIGNGRLGGMVCGEVARETIFLNDDTLWSGEPKDTLNYEAIKYLPKVRQLLLSGKEPEAHSLCNAKMLGPWNECYVPLGTLEVESPFQGEVVDYRRDLDLTQAVLRVQFRQDGATYHREIFASHPGQAIVLRLTSDQPGRINFRTTLKSPLHYVTEADNAMVTMKGRAPVHADPHYAGTVVVYEDGPNGRGTRFEARLKLIAEGGRVSSDGSRITVENADRATLILVAATSFNGPEKSPSRVGKNPAALCDGYLDGIAGKSYDDLLREHVADYRQLFGRVSLDLGQDGNARLPTDERLRKHKPGCDPSLPALYFQFGRYLLIASSRPGTQPANLQGIWNHNVNAIWSSNWTLNCNAQINYWPVEVANLSECHLPLIDLTRELSVNGTRTAKYYYGTEGWVAHHNADLWRASTPVGGDCAGPCFPVAGRGFAATSLNTTISPRTRNTCAASIRSSRDRPCSSSRTSRRNVSTAGS